MTDFNYFKDYKNKSGLLLSPYDKRDFKFKNLVPLGAFNIPQEYESEPFPFIYDQGQTQMCCACAYSAIRYLQEATQEQSQLKEPLSPAFIYGNRLPNENFEGMYIRSCCTEGLQGSVLYRELPGFYTTQKAIELVDDRKDELLAKAEPFKINSYYVCNSRIEIQQAIMTTKGIITGIPLFEGMFNVKSDGIISYNPTVDINNFGGHAVAITGWKEIDGVLYWRLLNSWGTNWGDKGYAWLPENYPWIENAYALVDDYFETTYSKYINEYYKTT